MTAVVVDSTQGPEAKRSKPDDNVNSFGIDLSAAVAPAAGIFRILLALCATRLDPKHAILVAAQCHVTTRFKIDVEAEKHRFLKLAAMHGSVAADRELADPKTAHNYTACALYPGGREEHAVRTGPLAPNENMAYLQDMADQGMPEAAATMAANLVFLHPEDDITEGMYYAERAASAGNLAGCALFAECLMKKGPRTADIKAKAHAWASRAATEQQYGAYVFGKLLASGFGEARDFDRAVMSFESVTNPVLNRRCMVRLAAAKDKRFVEYDTDDDEELANEAGLDAEVVDMDGNEAYMDEVDEDDYDALEEDPESDQFQEEYYE
jgi:hypothetical protein